MAAPGWATLFISLWKWISVPLLASPTPSRRCRSFCLIHHKQEHDGWRVVCGHTPSPGGTGSCFPPSPTPQQCLYTWEEGKTNLSQKLKGIDGWGGNISAFLVHNMQAMIEERFIDYHPPLGARINTESVQSLAGSFLTQKIPQLSMWKEKCVKCGGEWYIYIFI